MNPIQLIRTWCFEHGLAVDVWDEPLIDATHFRFQKPGTLLNPTQYLEVIVCNIQLEQCTAQSVYFDVIKKVEYEFQLNGYIEPTFIADKNTGIYHTVWPKGPYSASVPSNAQKWADAIAKPDDDPPAMAALRGKVDLDQRVCCPNREDVASCLYAKVDASLRAMIIHLNDKHKWTREAIADWLETTDLDLRIK